MLLLIHKIVWLSASVGSMVMGKEISATVTIINLMRWFRMWKPTMYNVYPSEAISPLGGSTDGKRWAYLSLQLN